MTPQRPSDSAVARNAAAAALIAAALGLSGCAGMGDSAFSQAFVDPAKYELFDCKQLEVERKSLDDRLAKLDGLMRKAQTGVAGPVVAEVAYRNDYINLKAQSRLAEQTWRDNRCTATPEPPAAEPAAPKRAGRGSR